MSGPSAAPGQARRSARRPAPGLTGRSRSRRSRAGSPAAQPNRRARSPPPATGRLAATAGEPVSSMTIHGSARVPSAAAACPAGRRSSGRLPDLAAQLQPRSRAAGHYLQARAAAERTQADQPVQQRIADHGRPGPGIGREERNRDQAPSSSPPACGPMTTPPAVMDTTAPGPLSWVPPTARRIRPPADGPSGSVARTPDRCRPSRRVSCAPQEAAADLRPHGRPPPGRVLGDRYPNRRASGRIAWRPPRSPARRW